MSACSRNAKLVYRNIHMLEISVSAVLWKSDIHEIRDIDFRLLRTLCCVCVCFDVCVCEWVSEWVWMSECEWVCVIVCVWVSVNEWVWVSEWVSVCVSVCLSVFVTLFSLFFFLNLNRLFSVFRMVMIIYFPTALRPDDGHGLHILMVFKSHTTMRHSR